MAGKPGDVYNLASGVETSILNLATWINDLTGNPTPIEFRPRRDWDHSGRRFGSTEKSKRDLGFEAQVSLREGLEKTVAWTQENMERIESCIQQHAKHMEVFA
jgi:nucleoside-diphosphate-sugar epimerase